MNRLLHRLIPTLMILLLPFTLQAEESIDAETLSPEASVQINPESGTNEAPVETVAEEASPAPSLMEEETADTTTVEDNSVAEEATTTVETAEAVAPVDDGTFAITTFEIEGNLLLSTEKIEQALQGFIGESKSRNDLFSIRYAIIKAYRKAELNGVAVAIPTTGEAGALQIRVFEDDIVDVYPQQSKKEAVKETPTTASQTASAETQTTDTAGPQTFAIKTYAAEKPAIIVRKQAPEPLPRAEEAAPVERPEQSASTDEALTTLVAEPVASKTEQVAAIQNETELQPSPDQLTASEQPEQTAVSSEAKTTTASDKPMAETKAELSATASKPPAIEESKTKPIATQAVVPAVAQKRAEVKKKITPPAASKKAAVAKREVVHAKKAAAKTTPESAPEAEQESAATAVIDAKQAPFKVASFKIYGNSLIKTEAIEKLLESYLGPDKTHEDLADARLQVSKLYRDQGIKMVAISMPSKIFSETIPVRIYEAKRR